MFGSSVPSCTTKQVQQMRNIYLVVNGFHREKFANQLPLPWDLDQGAIT
jgi:hypothetical protein